MSSQVSSVQCYTKELSIGVMGKEKQPGPKCIQRYTKELGIGVIQSYWERRNAMKSQVSSVALY